MNPVARSPIARSPLARPLLALAAAALALAPAACAKKPAPAAAAAAEPAPTAEAPAATAEPAPAAAEPAEAAPPAEAPAAENLIPADSGAARAGQVAEPFLTLESLTQDAEVRAALDTLRTEGATKGMAERFKSMKEEGYRVLLKALWADDVNLRTHAPTLLATLEPPITAEVAQAFSRSLLYDPVPAARANAAAALTDYNVPGTAPALMEVLEKDTDANARSLAAYAVGLLRDKSAIPALIKASRDKETWVRLRSVKALGKIGDASARAAVQAALKDPNPLVRDNAREAMRKLR